MGWQPDWVFPPEPAGDDEEQARGLYEEEMTRAVPWLYRFRPTNWLLARPWRWRYDVIFSDMRQQGGVLRALWWTVTFPHAHHPAEDFPAWEQLRVEARVVAPRAARHGEHPAGAGGVIPWWKIDTPGGRRGAELWIGPVGLSFTIPPQRPAWNWGWWRS